MPNPFPFPTFRKETQSNLDKEIVTDSDRKYMVRTLATMLTAYVQSPSLKQCYGVAKAVHSKYPFIGDAESEVHTKIHQL